MNIKERIATRKEELEKQQKFLEKQIKQSLPGTLLVYANRYGYRWYRRIVVEKKNHVQLTYLPKENIEIAKQLALKTYYCRQLDDIQEELMAIHAYQRALKKTGEQVSQVDKMLSNPGFIELLPDSIAKTESLNQSWQSQEYHHLEEYSNEKKIPVSRNLSVRSKSEAIIAKTLDQHRIPYRYECELVIQGTSFYPDFTIRHPKTGELFYWEHFGLMDNPSYAAGCARKIQVYSQEKIYPMQNLIITSEDGIRPLNPNLVQTLVEHYFLN